MKDVQQFAQEISLNEKQKVNVVSVKSNFLMRYLQVGKQGDVLVTSMPKLCEDLSMLGLASYFAISQIIDKKIYCVDGKFTKTVLIIMRHDYNSQIAEHLYGFVSQLNASIRVIDENEYLQQVAMEYIKDSVGICGFKSLFRNLEVDSNILKNTGMSIQYYACPLIGTESNAFNTLIQYYEEKYSYQN